MPGEPLRRSYSPLAEGCTRDPNELACNLADQLSGYGFPETSEITNLQDKTTRSADYVLAVVVGQTSRRLDVSIGPGYRMLVNDGETVYYNSRFYSVVTCFRDLAACIVGAIPADVEPRAVSRPLVANALTA